MSVRYVSLPPREAFRVIEEGLTNGAFSAELITSHIPRPQKAGDVESVVGVFEKYTFRTGTRMTLTVLCSPAGKTDTEVFFVAGGASGSVFGLFDLGAGDSFEEALTDVIEPYLCRESE